MNMKFELMKSSEIHKGLPQKETRDFLSLSMVKALDNDANNKKKVVEHNQGDDVLEWAKANAREEIIFLEKYIKNINNKQAILILIKNNDWEEFDVSEYVSNDCGYNNHPCFIGTKEEYEILYDQLNKY